MHLNEKNGLSVVLYDYSRLLGKIKELYDTQEDFATALGIGQKFTIIFLMTTRKTRPRQKKSIRRKFYPLSIIYFVVIVICFPLPNLQ
ncbi:DUF739 family protein [Anaeromicropila populeti]|uniref:DUF739 family protein n=1 Tax=Anaeromicropila populeti TaxID=37658 RepID=UPI0011604BE6